MKASLASGPVAPGNPQIPSSSLRHRPVSSGSGWLRVKVAERLLSGETSPSVSPWPHFLDCPASQAHSQPAYVPRALPLASAP